MSLRVFVKKRRPPKPAFFALSSDGYDFIKVADPGGRPSPEPPRKENPRTSID